MYSDSTGDMACSLALAKNSHQPKKAVKHKQPPTRPKNSTWRDITLRSPQTLLRPQTPGNLIKPRQDNSNSNQDNMGNKKITATAQRRQRGICSVNRRLNLQSKYYKLKPSLKRLSWGKQTSKRGHFQALYVLKLVWAFILHWSTMVLTFGKHASTIMFFFVWLPS